MHSILVFLCSFFHKLRCGVFPFIAMAMVLMTPACATMHADGYQGLNTCDVSKFEPGHPDCLPPPGFFCVDPPAAPKETATLQGASQYIGQLFPSHQALGANQPICPPNATRFVQDMDWKDARDGARKIGHTVGRVLATCERIVQDLAKEPDHMLAGQNTTQPEELEARFMLCTRELDSLPAIPEYEDPWLASAAAAGFKEGYGNGEREVWLRLLLLDVALATLESAILPGLAFAEVAATRGIRASLNLVRRMPIFIPGAVGGGGAVAFLKGAPRAVKTVVAGSSRRLASNMFKVMGKIRLPGEFAHHIVAHGAERAKRSVEILEQFGIKVDDAINGVFLPGYDSSPNPLKKVVHGNLHTNAYYDAVEQRLRKAAKAGTRANVEQALREIAWELEHGIIPQ